MLKRIVGAAVLPLVMVGVLAGCGQIREHHYGTPVKVADRMEARITKKLKLDDAQQQKLHAVRVEIMEARAQRRSQRDGMFDEWIAEMSKPEMDKAKIVDLMERRREMMETAAPAVIDRWIEFHASLSDAQRGEIVEKLERFKAWDQKG